MNQENKLFDKLVKKALSFAYENDIEINNYPATEMWISGNDVHVTHTNEYGGQYSVCSLYGVANWIFSYSEFKKLAR